MSFELAGIGASGGIAIGTALVLEPTTLDIPEHLLATEAVEDEVLRLRAALSSARDELFAVRDVIPADAPQDTRLFIDAHLLMLDDPALRERPLRSIREDHRNAAWAIQLERERLLEIFDRMEDAYLRAKREDIIQVTDRVLRQLVGGKTPGLQSAEGQIIIAEELTPADTVLMKKDKVSAWVTDFGAANSHAAILARSLGLPAVVGAHSATRLLRSGDTVIVDGDQGIILVAPDALVLRQYQGLQEQRHRRRRLLEEQRDLPAVTLDGVTIHLRANIELPDDSSLVRRMNADGVGLYRSEFLFMNRPDIPDEEEQYQAFSQVVKEMAGAPVTIRSLDIGADKRLKEDEVMGHNTLNPALGLRGLRLCLRRPEWFRPHLRAILRASALGPVRLMLPMLSSMSQLLQSRALVSELQAELRGEGLDCDPDMPLGIMVEVPAVAMAAHYFAACADFFSIGTNDLIQYALAVDRGDDDVNDLFDPLHVGVLGMIQHTIAAGHSKGIPVSMCGEMAANPAYTPLLLGLGLREFSMYPGAIPEVKEIIRQTSIAEAEQLALGALTGEFAVPLEAGHR
ncbi:phosphoenolpyruvate--protein phosphotransferase [Acidithiobacillus marinus]|uniref:Phosphoenolpyruvate-protein phosphotransferase n=1 Tax=Acidithiobacillus marinus TaxID=187490 RepID=A0A2I1DQN1_9PROT|nr:phosphoenolpyruvate--protein phosphotransferase [Acidithiobacillus marinus]PKY12178.1 phosphoenolpyruvate--protein phosphotransferase [Acidithiobacillus marinus]